MDAAAELPLPTVKVILHGARGTAGPPTRRRWTALISRVSAKGAAITGLIIIL